MLAVQAFGFPLFKLRDQPRRQGEPGVFRDFEQVPGTRRWRRTAVRVPWPSTWTTLPPASRSRGPVAVGRDVGGRCLGRGRIVGVVAEHHPSEGTGRLTARRIDRAYEQLPASDLGRLVKLLGLAPAAGGLPDVVPPSRASSCDRPTWRRSATSPPTRSSAARTSWRSGPSSALAPTPYAWWQAGPWAGKSALASWFVTHPPAGVDVVSFFITGRLSGQADSDAFLDAMIEQLNALDPAAVDLRRRPGRGSAHG